MEYWWLIIPVIFVHVLMAFVAAPPNALARKFFKKFDVHQQLNEEIIKMTVTLGEAQLDGQEKQHLIKEFNNAIFGYRYYKMPASSGTPFTINYKQGKHDVRLFLYLYDNRVDVFKEYKNMVIAYRLVSESLQELAHSSNSPLISV